jgi:hypothetical protein
MMDEIERLLELGKKDLEAGYPEYARQYFEQVLSLDADNAEALEAIARIDEMLRPKPPSRLKGAKEDEELEEADSSEGVGVEEADLPEDEEVRETDLSGRWDLELPPMDLLIELLRFQCQQLERIEVELLKQGVILEKQAKHLNNISTMASLVMLLIVIAVVLTMCSSFLSPSPY